jgi:hypothetical protein
MNNRRPLLAAAVIVIMVIPLLAGWGQPAAAGGSWSAWLYRQDTGQLVHIMPDGAAATSMAFPLPPGTSTNPYVLAFSRNEALLAACLTDNSGNPSVRIYDIYNHTYVGAYILSGPIQACSLGRYAFNEDGTRLAFGILNHYPDPADPRPDWELIVMATDGSSAIINRLASNNPAVAALGTDYRGMLPEVTAFESNVIAFRPIRWGTEGAPEYDSLVWQLTSGDVTRIGPYGKSSLDFLIPNGEAIWIEQLPDFPTGYLEGMGFLFNVVMYSNKAGDWYPIFHQPGGVIEEARMIQGGQRAAVRVYTYPGPSQWWYLDRTGPTGLLPVGGNVYDLWGTLDGYVYMDPQGSPVGGPMLTYHRYTGGAGPEVQNLWTADPGSHWQIIWVNPLSGGAGLTPFLNIGAPALPPPAMATPSLHTGGSAIVHTTEGDMLRIRSGPGTGYGVQFQLPDGAPVTLLEGPTAVGGYNWWFIRAGDGRSGWAVEAVPEGDGWLQTLIPTG